MSSTAEQLAASDPLILVDSQDREVGSLSKAECHEGSGVLHRAFSLFLFNPAGELLLQQRSAHKRLWGGYWANSCCSHPRLGEKVEEAAIRRVREELGVSCRPRFLYKFEYHAQFGDAGAEHELCWVYAADLDREPRPNPDEISSVRWVSPEQLTQEIAQDPGRFTPWLKLEWARISRDFLGGIQAGRR
ncbi:MAG: isopentenyl-diphosphate Delta-isomerase [Chromatiales bacterium]|nr:isopentenyl-diphosphate Delta-isomerase [Chromatiales bacterium]